MQLSQTPPQASRKPHHHQVHHATPHRCAITPLFELASSAVPAVGTQRACHWTPLLITRFSSRVFTHGPMRKQVQFDLGDDQVLADLASFLGSARDEWAPTPAPAATSSQCHDTSAGGAWSRTSTAALTKLMAASQAPTSHPTSLDPMRSP